MTNSNPKFWRGFSPYAVFGRDGAVSAVVAGTMSGGVLVAIALLRIVMRLLMTESPLSSPLIAESAALGIALAITWMTWKRLIIGPAVGLLISLGLLVWLSIQGRLVFAGILVPVLLGGFLSAIRGIRLLNRRHQR